MKKRDEKYNIWGRLIKSEMDKKPVKKDVNKKASLAEQINWGGKYKPVKKKQDQ